MTTVTAEKDELLDLIRTLHDEDVEKVISYAAYLRHIEEQEEAGDIAYFEAHKDDPSVPLEEALKELGL